jgi:hypothetical protein
MKLITRLLIVVSVFGCLSLRGSATECLVASFVPQEKKILSEFRGVRLGFKADEVHAKLGKPASVVESREEFTFDGDNQITIHLENGEVRAIQIVFMEATKAPTWTDVVGDAEVNQMESGAKFARKVVNAEHFWVSMYKSKDGTMTRITISR